MRPKLIIVFALALFSALAYGQNTDFAFDDCSFATDVENCDTIEYKLLDSIGYKNSLVYGLALEAFGASGSQILNRSLGSITPIIFIEREHLKLSLGMLTGYNYQYNFYSSLSGYLQGVDYKSLQFRYADNNGSKRRVTGGGLIH
jgi:hypothetical protein